jgi:aspartate ammonia-lyase
VNGIMANEDRCRHFAERSAGLITALSNQLGYLNCAAIEKEALSAHKSIRQIVLEKKLMTEEELKKALNLDAMTRGAG